MHLPQEVYIWLVDSSILANQGEKDEKGNVTLPPQQSVALQNGYLIGEVVRRIATNTGKKVPSALINVKSDSSKNTRLTNWNFIWLAFETIGLKLDTRIKELILEGEQALIVEVLRQLYDKDPLKGQNSKTMIRQRVSGKAKGGGSPGVDLKRINLIKDPEESESSLQFLILLLKASLGMNLQEILGLFTNQNKYLAHIIVKGTNDNFDPIVFFYSLLNKHALKLKAFYEQDRRDAEACLFALKPGFISKDQRVVELALELFGKLGNIFEWFISEESKCAGTFLIGIKRHPALRELYWLLLLDIIQGEQLDFFTKYYAKAFQSPLEQIEITTYLLKYIAQSFLGEKLSNIGITTTWLQTATMLPQGEMEAQLVAFDFMGELMLYLPDVIEQNEESLLVLTRNWEKRTLAQFAILFNQLIGVLQRLAEGKSQMARRIYLVVAEMARLVGPGDKRDYLVQGFLPLIAKFPSIPSEYLIQCLKDATLSNSQFLLICESIEVNYEIQTLVGVGNFLKQLFIENPLINFYVLTLIKQIVEKIIGAVQGGDMKAALTFMSVLLEDTLHSYALAEIKYKPKPKQQKSMYFGRSGSPDKVSKQEEQQLLIKQKWKELYLALIVQLTDLSFSEDSEQVRELIKQKVMNTNSYIRLNNHKVGSKQLEQLLVRRFEVSKNEQIRYSEEFKERNSANAEEEIIKRSKAQSNATISTKLKGPDVLVKEFQGMVDRRKQEEQQRRAIQMRRQSIEQKKKMSVKKQLEITNLLRGQIGEAQIREYGFLQRLMPYSHEGELVPLEQLQGRDVEAIECMMRRYHRVLRHLFLLHTGTMYSNHTAEKIEDNQRRKEILTAGELGKLLKEYRIFQLTSQPQINGMVRDINVRLLGRREVGELDFKGFQQYIIQFCFLKMTVPYQIVTGVPPERVIRNLKNQPIHVLLTSFFAELKEAFIARGQKVSIFDHIEDTPHSNEQMYEMSILNQQLGKNPNYILPKGYKKIVEKTMEFPYRVSSQLGGLTEKFQIAIDALDYILSKPPLSMHFIENIADKIVTYKVKPTSLGSPQGFPRERAMSTVIDRKELLLMELGRHRGSSKGIVDSLKLGNRESMGGGETDYIAQKVNQKQVAKQKKSISVAKLAEIEKSRYEAMVKRAKEKQEQREKELQKEREDQRKRREHAEKFSQQQKLRLIEKRKKQQQQKTKKVKEDEQKEVQKKQNKQKFKALHQNQVQRIKKIEVEASDKIKREKEDQLEQKEKAEELRRRLREKIQEEDKHITQTRKQIESKLTTLEESEPIKSTFQKYQPNLKALFDFLIKNTHLSLTQKRHNNEIIYDTWRYFLNAFELTPLIVHAKDVVGIFKSLTKDTVNPKEYLIGLDYQEFQQALLRIAIKYKIIFNIISEKIKDKIEESKEDKNKKGSKKGGKEGKSQSIQKPKPVVKQQSQFDKAAEINIKELIKQNNEGKDDIDEYGDLSKVNEKTLRGLIFYLKVPSTKIGQELRFREVLAEKHSHSIQNADRLKQKLNEQYSLQTSPKKEVKQKSPSNVANKIGPFGAVPQKSLK